MSEMAVRFADSSSASFQRCRRLRYISQMDDPRKTLGNLDWNLLVHTTWIHFPHGSASSYRVSRRCVPRHFTCNARQHIFWDDEDRRLFLSVLDQVVSRFRLVLHAYCLMDNHS